MCEYIGIDLGGTNIRICSINENEEMEFVYKEKTYDEKNETNLYEKIKRLIKFVPNYKDVKAIGMGITGVIDCKTGQVVHSNNAKQLSEKFVAKDLEKEFGIPVYIKNDAKVACLGEAIKGSGKDYNIVCYITISTGLGGGVTIKNKIYDGSTNLGGYLSRMILDGNNTANSLVSGTALIKSAKQKIGINIESAQEVFDLAKQGNKEASEIVKQFKNNLVVLLLNVSYTINPDVIILGGGVMKQKDEFLDDVILEFRKKEHENVKNTEIKLASLDEPGAVGAALLAKYIK